MFPCKMVERKINIALGFIKGLASLFLHFSLQQTKELISFSSNSSSNPSIQTDFSPKY
jgi:hypothetical protein